MFNKTELYNILIVLTENVLKNKLYMTPHLILTCRTFNGILMSRLHFIFQIEKCLKKYIIIYYLKLCAFYNKSLATYGYDLLGIFVKYIKSFFWYGIKNKWQHYLQYFIFIIITIK